MLRRLTLLITLLSCSSLALAQSDHGRQERINDFEAWLEDAIDRGEFVGVSAAFEIQDDTWAAGFGFADLENRVPVSVESSFRMASVTKPMTAVGVLTLVQEGKVSLDDNVQVYVPDFPVKSHPVTIRHLLRHTSGISHYKNYGEEARHMKQMSTGEALSVFQNWELEFEPGTDYGYTTYGYNLLGAVIEGATGQSYGDYMAESVWGPLAMDHTRLDSPSELVSHRVRGYVRTDDGFENSFPVNTSMKYAGGGTRSIAADMVRFAQGVSDGRILKPEWVDSMWTSGATTDGRYTRYGYGWSTTNFNGHFMVGHGGSQEATRTSLLHIPSAEATVVVLSNLEGSNPQAVAMKLMAAILDEDDASPPAYLATEHDETIYAAMRWCFSDGFSYFDRYRRAMTDNAEDLTAAFDYFDRLVGAEEDASSLEEMRKWVDHGRHPVAGLPFATIGSYIAEQLHARYGDDYIRRAHSRGPVAMYADYADLSSADDSLPSIDPEFRRQLSSWNESWAESWTPAVREVTIGPAMDVETARATLVQAFRKKSIYPDFTGSLGPASISVLAQGDRSQALDIAQLALELYPGSDEANTAMGIVRIAEGNPAEGKKLIVKALERDPNGAARQGRLNSVAYQLAATGQYDAAIGVLDVAIDLNPEVANLYDSKAEMSLLKGDLDAAREWYLKAASMDPGFENPRRMLERIDQMTGVESSAPKAGSEP